MGVTRPLTISAQMSMLIEEKQIEEQAIYRETLSSFALTDHQAEGLPSGTQILFLE